MRRLLDMVENFCALRARLRRTVPAAGYTIGGRRVTRDEYRRDLTVRLQQVKASILEELDRD